MTDLRESDVVPLSDVDDVEREGGGKTVVAARLRLEERYGPTAARRVVSIETRDGAIYRFQRYGSDEFLAFYNRENPDGSEFKRKAPLPGHVEQVRRAIMDGDVLPELAALVAAERAVGTFETDDTTEQATDADVREAVEQAEERPQTEQKRRAEAGLRAGYATDGGTDDCVGHEWALCSDPLGAIECDHCGETFEGPPSVVFGPDRGGDGK